MSSVKLICLSFFHMKTTILAYVFLCFLTLFGCLLTEDYCVDFLFNDLSSTLKQINSKHNWCFDSLQKQKHFNYTFANYFNLRWHGFSATTIDPFELQIGVNTLWIWLIQKWDHFYCMMWNSMENVEIFTMCSLFLRNPLEMRHVHFIPEHDSTGPLISPPEMLQFL
jgi:hypothetical protein